MISKSIASASLLVVALASLAGCAETTPPAIVVPPKNEAVQHQILSGRTEGTPKELAERGERALLGQKWREAADAYEALYGAEPQSKDAPSWLMSLATAYEGLAELPKARETYRLLASRFPGDPQVRGAVVREASLDAYLEDYKALGELGDKLLASP